MAKKKELYTPTEGKYAPHGITATVLGAASLLCLLILVGLSMYRGGGIGYWSGAVGVTAFVVAFCGMLVGFKSFSDECRSYLLSKIGTLLCGSMVAAWFLLCCVGLAN